MIVRAGRVCRQDTTGGGHRCRVTFQLTFMETNVAVSPCGTHHVRGDVPLYTERFDEVLKFHARGLAAVRGSLAHPDGRRRGVVPEARSESVSDRQDSKQEVRQSRYARWTSG